MSAVRRPGIRFCGVLLALAVSAGGFAAEAPLAAAATSAARGHLVLNGGGGESDPFWPTVFRLAGGKDAAIVILPTASERAETGQEYVDELKAILTRFPGESMVFIHLGEDKVLRLPDQFCVDTNGGLIGELRVLLGQTAIL